MPAKGNLKTDTKREISSTRYGRANLPSELEVKGKQVNYLYDANDMRIYKRTQQGEAVTNSEYYLRNSAGQEIAVIDLSTNKIDMYIFGTSRIAKLEHQQGALDGTMGDGNTGGDTPTEIPIKIAGKFSDKQQLSTTDVFTLGKVSALNDLKKVSAAPEEEILEFPNKLLELQLEDKVTYTLETKLHEYAGQVYTVLSEIVLHNKHQQLELSSRDGERLIMSIGEVLDMKPSEVDLGISPVDPFTTPLDIMENIPVPQLHYYIHDHLGNTRVTYSTGLTCTGEPVYRIDNAVDYYPYGKVLREYRATTAEKYLTTHHERDEETGLDYRGARMYDADVARFLSLDPLAADYPSWSDYNYVLGNPVMLIDPDGRSPIGIAIRGGGILLKTIKILRKTRKIRKASGAARKRGGFWKTLKKVAKEVGKDIKGDAKGIFKKGASFGSRLAALADLALGTNLHEGTTVTTDEIVEVGVPTGSILQEEINNESIVHSKKRTLKPLDDFLGWTDEQVSEKHKELSKKGLTSKEKALKKKLEQEQKCRQQRNAQKRKKKKDGK